jgi:hypothetical protein
MASRVIISPPALAPYPQTWWQGTIFNAPNVVINDSAFQNGIGGINNTAATSDMNLLDSHIATEMGNLNATFTKVIVIGHSRGAQIIYKWLREKGAASSFDPNKLMFVGSGNPERKYNGASGVDPTGHPAVYPGTAPWGNGLGIPSSIRYTLLDLGRQYDQWCDHPGDLSNTASHDLIMSGSIHTNYGQAPELGIDGWPTNWNDFTIEAVEGNVTYAKAPTYGNLPGDSLAGLPVPTQAAYTTIAKIYGPAKRRADEDYGFKQLQARASLENGFRRPCPPPTGISVPAPVTILPPRPYRWGAVGTSGIDFTTGSSNEHVAVNESATFSTQTYATPTFVQVKSATTSGGTNSTLSCTFTGAQTAGNTNIVAIGFNNITSTISSVVDSAGNVYQVAAPLTRNGTSLSQAIYYAPAIAAAATNTITVTFSGATPSIDIRAAEYSGIATTSSVDQTASASGSSTSAVTPAVTTTLANELIFGAGMTTGVFSAAGSGFTSRIITPGNGDILEDRAVSTVGSYTATATLGSAAWLIQVVTFKAAIAALTGGGGSSSPGTPLFLGDYSTNNFAQWDVVQDVDYNSYAVNFVPSLHTNADGQTYYPIQIVNDAVWHKAARFEVHGGDYPGFISGDRAEMQRDGSIGAEGTTGWFRLATKFDTGFPMNHATMGWGVTNQWHATDAGGGGPVGGIVNWQDGYWTIIAEPQSAPATYLGKVAIWQTPLDIGNWHEVKLKIVWSISDSIGAISVWHNGIPQTLTNGSTVYNIRTLVPGGGDVYYKEGYYRQRDLPSPGALFHAGFAWAANEADLPVGH